MKFLELKKDLTNNKRACYLISGNDRYLCYAALDQIKAALNITLPQMNEVILGAEASGADIAQAASVFPFMDEYRLVLVNDFGSKKLAAEDKLIEYLKNPLAQSVIVLFCPEGADLKNMAGLYAPVDCDRLDVASLEKVLSARLKKNNMDFDPKALEKLILFCNNDMARLDGELVKLMSFCQGRSLQTQDVEKLVVEDKEYQVFELSEFIARGEGQKALDLVYTLSNSKSGFSVVAPLYNNFRRALFVAINRDKTDEELASLLAVKPYAIKMTKGQVRYYTPKKLKQIVDLIYETDRDIKTGKIKEEVAIKTLTLNILRIRG